MCIRDRHSLCAVSLKGGLAVERLFFVRLAGFIKLSPFCGSAPSPITATLVCYPAFSFVESKMRVVIFLAALLCSLSSLAAEVCKVGTDVERVSVGEVSLAYQSIGRSSDPALLLVMGLGGQLIHWPDDVVEQLCEQGFRVIRFDNRDVGLSRWNAEAPTANLAYEVLRYRLGLAVGAPYSLRDMAGDSLGLMDCLLYTSPSPRDLSTSRMPSSA